MGSKMKAIEDANRWQTKSLRDLATINYGRSPADILADDGSYPVVGTGGSERRGNAYLHEGESVILGRKGTIDRVYFATGRFWTIDTAYYLTDFREAVPRWMYYFLQTVVDQLDGLDWEVIDLEKKQYPGHSHRQGFSGNILTCRQNVIVYVT